MKPDLGWGIYQDDGASGADLLRKIRSTFEWIRLAQRVPVRVCLGGDPQWHRALGWHDRLGAGDDRSRQSGRYTAGPRTVTMRHVP